MRPEVCDTFVFNSKEDIHYAVVMTQVDHEKMEGRFKFFVGPDAAQQAKDWINGLSRPFSD